MTAVADPSQRSIAYVGLFDYTRRGTAVAINQIIVITLLSGSKETITTDNFTGIVGSIESKSHLTKGASRVIIVSHIHYAIGAVSHP